MPKTTAEPRDVDQAPPPVPDAVAPPPRHPRFPLLDGMRAVAVLTVLAVHAAIGGNVLTDSLGGRVLAHLNVGVTIFFLISGFLLYRPFVAPRGGGPPAPRIAAYFGRRALRILPAYWLAIAILAALPGTTSVVGGHWLPMVALVHTLPVYHGRTCVQSLTSCGLAQTWSLVVEATFYVALPVYALAMGALLRRVGRRSWVWVELLALAALSAVSVVLEFVALRDPVPRWFSGTAAGYVLWFALGMGMAVVSAAARDRARPAGVLGWLAARPALAWGLAAGVYAVLCWRLPANPFFLSRGERLAVHLGFAAIAGLLLLPAVFAAEGAGAPRRLLAHPVVAWVGLVSYGVFLWHYEATLKLGVQGAKLPFVVVLLGTLGIAIACAAASYYLVERPLLRLKYRRPRRHTRARAAATVP